MMDRTFFARKKRRSSFLVILFFSVFLFAESPSIPRVAIFPLQSDNETAYLQSTLDDLVFSFIKEERAWKVIDMRASNSSEHPLPADVEYVFSGRINTNQEGITLELKLKGGPDSTTRIISKVYDNSNRILLESRSIVKSLFDLSIPVSSDNMQAIQSSELLSPNTDMDTALVPVASIDSLAGTWYGESGIEKIMILRGGRGVAVLTSGISISLELMISNGDLVIRQKGPMTSRQFIDLPEAVAKQASVASPPPEWRFRQNLDASILLGTKQHIRIYHDGKNILKMESLTINVKWSKQ